MALLKSVANVYSQSVRLQQIDWTAIVVALLGLPLTRLAGTNSIWCVLPLYFLSRDR